MVILQISVLSHILFPVCLILLVQNWDVTSSGTPFLIASPFPVWFSVHLPLNFHHTLYISVIDSIALTTIFCNRWVFFLISQLTMIIMSQGYDGFKYLRALKRSKLRTIIRNYLFLRAGPQPHSCIPASRTWPISHWCSVNMEMNAWMLQREDNFSQLVY